MRIQQIAIFAFLAGVSTSFLVISLQIDLSSSDDSFPDYPREELYPQNLGRMIVEKTFNESYADMVDHCAEAEDMKVCMHQLYKLGQDDSTPYARRWPWWFQTMLRDGGRTSSGLHAGWHVLHYSQQEPRTQQCVFEKGGTKKFRKLHCLAIKSTFTYTQPMKCHQGQAKPPGSQKVVFLRDPLDRFLSGFLDKCVESPLEKHCEPRSVFSNPQNGPVNDFIGHNEQKLFEIYVDTLPLTWNIHFFPQSLFCNGLYRDIADYSFIGNLGNGFYRDLGRFSEQYPALEHLVEKIFHTDEKENVTMNQGVETMAANHTLEFYTPHTLRRVLEYCAIDYVMLGLPIPSWAERMLTDDAGGMLADR